jgi:phosphoenolpyruvate carboxylase
VKVEPVFTAHPTEAKRVTVLEHHRELFMLAEAAASSGNSLKGAGRERAKLIIERLWRTGEIYVDKPDVQSEVRNVFYYLEEIFPEALALADK